MVVAVEPDVVPVDAPLPVEPVAPEAVVGCGSPVIGGVMDVVGSRVAEGTDDEEPDPVMLESCANPTDGGFERKTEYTFFCATSQACQIHRQTHFTGVTLTRKVSPNIQFGVPEFAGIVTPNIDPMHRELSSGSKANTISSSLIGQVLPPNEMDTATGVLQARIRILRFIIGIT